MGRSSGAVFTGSPPNLTLPLIWNTGLGALTHLQLPADQTGTIAVKVKTAADASQAGSAFTAQAANAIAGTLTEGAAAGGSHTVQAGNAARLTSGSANGGGILLTTGTPVGTGTAGQVIIGPAAGHSKDVPHLAFAGDLGTGFEWLAANSFSINSNTLRRFVITINTFKTSSVGEFVFASGDAQDTTADVGFNRVLAGVLRVSDGSTGMGKIMAEEVQVSSDTTSRAKFKVTKVTRAHDSALFNAAGLTDSEAIYTQPANSILIAAYMVLDTQFAAVGMTDLDVTIGDVGNNTGILNASMNLTSDAATTRYATKGAYFDATAGMLLREAATAWTAYATAVGANLSTTSAGSVSFYFVTLEW